MPFFPTGDVDCNGIVDVEDLLALPGVTEVMVNRWDRIFPDQDF